MLELISLFAMMLLSLLVIRCGATALRLTGVSNDVARFQAKSAFTGVGFTTAESVLVLEHPVRRQIISFLITSGGFGVPLILATLMIAITNSDDGALQGRRLLAGFCCIGALLLAARLQLIDRFLERVIEWALKNWSQLEVVDYQSMLEIERGYRVGRIAIRDGAWLAQGQNLREMRLAQAGILVIGIHRGGEYIGAPDADMIPTPGDELLCYGQQAEIEELAIRKQGQEGDLNSFEAMRRHADRLAQESALLAEVNMRSESSRQTGFFSSIRSVQKSRAA